MSTHCLSLHVQDLDHKAPEWMHLLPAGTPLESGLLEIHSRDGRTFTSPPLAGLAASFDRKIPIDIGHASHDDSLFSSQRPLDKAAVGWIDAFEARDDGLWGHVDWLEQGRSLVESRQFVRQSPTLEVDEDGMILGLVSAALTNVPALTLTELAERQSPPKETMNKTFELLCAQFGLAYESASLEAVLCAARKGHVPEEQLAGALSRAEAAEKAVSDAATAQFEAEVESVIGSAVKAMKITPAERGFFLAGCSDADGLARTRAHLETLQSKGLDKIKAPTGSPATGDDLTARQIAMCATAGITPEQLKAHKAKY